MSVSERHRRGHQASGDWPSKSQKRQHANRIRQDHLPLPECLEPTIESGERDWLIEYLHDWGMPDQEIAGHVGAGADSGRVAHVLAQRTDHGMHPVVLGRVLVRLAWVNDDARRWHSEIWTPDGGRASEITIGDVLKGALASQATLRTLGLPPTLARRGRHLISTSSAESRVRRP